MGFHHLFLGGLSELLLHSSLHLTVAPWKEVGGSVFPNLKESANLNIRFAWKTLFRRSEHFTRGRVQW